MDRTSRTTAVPIGLWGARQLSFGLVLLRLQLLSMATASIMSLCLRLKRKKKEQRANLLSLFFIISFNLIDLCHPFGFLDLITHYTHYL